MSIINNDAETLRELAYENPQLYTDDSKEISLKAHVSKILILINHC